MSTRQVIHIDETAIADEALTAFTGVVLSGGEAEYGDANEAIDGIVLADAAEGQDVRVCRQGLTTMKVATAAGVEAGDIATVNASGQLVALAGSSNDGNVLVLETPAADGDYVQVYFDAFNLSNVTAGE